MRRWDVKCPMSFRPLLHINLLAETPEPVQRLVSFFPIQDGIVRHHPSHISADSLSDEAAPCRRVKESNPVNSQESLRLPPLTMPASAIASCLTRLSQPLPSTYRIIPINIMRPDRDGASRIGGVNRNGCHGGRCRGSGDSPVFSAASGRPTRHGDASDRQKGRIIRI